MVPAATTSATWAGVAMTPRPYTMPSPAWVRERTMSSARRAASVYPPWYARVNREEAPPLMADASMMPAYPPSKTGRTGSATLLGGLGGGRLLALLQGRGHARAHGNDALREVHRGGAHPPVGHVAAQLGH